MNTKLKRFEEGDVVRLSKKELIFRKHEADVSEINRLYIVHEVFEGWVDGGYLLRTYYPINEGGEDPMRYKYLIVEEDGVEGATLMEYLNYEGIL